MEQLDLAHLDSSFKEILKLLEPKERDKYEGIYKQLLESFNAEAIGFCLDKYITAELDYVTFGDRGIGRASTYVPRLGAYHRKKMATLNTSDKAKLYNLIEDVVLRSYLTAPLFLENPLRERKVVDTALIFNNWIPGIYGGRAENISKVEALWQIAGFPLQNLMEFFAQRKMSGAGVFSKDKTPEICSYYPIAGMMLRLVEIGEI